MAKAYCPYTDSELDEDAMSPEHIIPLALGGCNQFVLPVCKEFNSRAGSEIDGELARDFLISFRRRDFDARGHSKKAPETLLRRSLFVDRRAPIQVEFAGEDGVRIWDPVARRQLIDDEILERDIESHFFISRHARLKFGAKVALSAGYLFFGELFRTRVKHHELRALMSFSAGSKPSDFDGFGLEAYDEFSPCSDSHREFRAVEEYLCKFVGGSCVIAVVGPHSVSFSVGILGQHTATLRVPAVTDDFPRDGDFESGHVAVIQRPNLLRFSFRQLLLAADHALNREANG